MSLEILFVTAFPPFPIDRTGGGIRSRLLIDALSQCGRVRLLFLNYRGHAQDLGQVAVSPFADGALEVVDSILMSRGKLLALAEKTARGLGFMFGGGIAAAGLRVKGDASRVISELIERKEVDLVVGRLSRPTAVAGLLDELRLPLIVDADDWEPFRAASRIRAAPYYNFPLRAYLHRYRQGSDFLGSRILDRADHVWLASEADTSLIGRSHVTTLPNLPIAKSGDQIVPLLHSEASSKVLFAVGQWERAQNSDGMNWFLRSVWPAISERIPQAELRISGAIPEALARGWAARPNVRVLGFVDELRPEYETAAMVVTPITWGGGTKIKVLEALAYGRVPLGPEHAFEGLANSPKLHDIAVIENDASKLADTAVSLLNDPAQRISREVAAVDYYKNNYLLAAFDAHVRKTVEGVMQV